MKQLLKILTCWLAVAGVASSQVYPYFSPGGALSGNATSQNVNLAAGTPFIVGTLPTARLPALSGDCTTPGGSGVLTCTQINGVTPGGTCTNQAVTSISASAVPTCSTLTSSFVNNTIALTGVDVNTSSQVTATHLATALPVTQGGTGVATLTGLALGNGASAFSAYGGTGCTNQFPRSLSTTGIATCATVANTDLANSSVTLNGASLALGGTRTLTLASADFVNQGTTTTLLHGNAAGNPSFASVANADLTNSSITLNGSSVSLGGTRTLTLASADYANQGTTTTVLHGAAAGNPSFSAVSVTTDISGTLPVANGGTGTASTLTGLIRGSASAMTAAELSGDVTTSGSNAATIANNAVTNAKLAQMAANTVKCNNTAGTANAIDCTVAQAQTLLAIPGTLDVQTFATPGANTWTKPAGVPLYTNGLCVGAGGGGGSGAQVALGTAESGGGGGGGGGMIQATFATASLGGTETVTIGTGGTAGAATGGVGAGNGGGQGGASSFGTWIKAWGGGGGAGGASAANSGGGGGAGATASGNSTTTATGGNAGTSNGSNGGSGTFGATINNGGLTNGGAGGAGDTSGAAGSQGGINYGGGGPGGGSGGGLTAVAATAGGNGGITGQNATAPTGGANTGGTGGAGVTSAAAYTTGTGGAGGGGNAAGAGGTGGVGGRGAGGGGGGASAGGNSGAGGAGGNGYCVVATFY